MGRIPPSKSAPRWQEPTADERLILHLKLITPLFGGGYEAREVDPICIIRPATVRGHLRYWWRALYGAMFSSAAELYEEESRIWGAAAEDKQDAPGVGKVALRVENVVWTKKKKTIQDFKPRGRPAKVGPEAQYLLYTFQEQRKEKIPPAEGYDGVSFDLCLTFDRSLSEEQRTQVQNTLKAWIAFGGVGARTRRGCGALTVTQELARWLPPADTKAREEWFRSLLPKQIATEHPKMTVLWNTLLVSGQADDVTQAHNILHDLGSFWARFRKGHVGKGETYQPMAGSRWSDYRRALIPFQRRNANAISLSKPFWGLPIVYQAFNSAPYAPTIESEETGRMASPVILKPMALANGKACPICAVMWAPMPRRVSINPPGQTVDLKVPQNDPVLQALGVKHPIAAVIKAAEQVWNTKAIKLGG